MSKKFTSFLVVLAALLLTVPTQAQFAKKAAKQTTVLKAGPLKVNDVQKVKAAKAMTKLLVWPLLALCISRLLQRQLF